MAASALLRDDAVMGWDDEDIAWARRNKTSTQLRTLYAGEQVAPEALATASALLAVEALPAPATPTRVLVCTVGRQALTRAYLALAGPGTYWWKPQGERRALRSELSLITRMLQARLEPMAEVLRSRPSCCTRCGATFGTGDLQYLKLWAQGQWVAFCEPCHRKQGTADMTEQVYVHERDWHEGISAKSHKKLVRTADRLREAQEMLTHGPRR